MGEETPLRAIRISDKLWTKARIKAEKQNTTVSEAIRAFLERWTKD